MKKIELKSWRFRIPRLHMDKGITLPHSWNVDDDERVQRYRGKTLPNMVGYVWFPLNDYRTHCGEAGAYRMRRRVHGSTDLEGNPKPSYNVLKELE